MKSYKNSVVFLFSIVLVCPAMAAMFYVGPSATGNGSGSDESNLMAYATWKGSSRTSDSCYYVGMDSTISEDFYWPACLGYYAKYAQVYTTRSIGWRFDTYTQIFQFANGDIGVVDSGDGVNIVELVPNPTTADCGVYGVVAVHGAMVDPVVSWEQGIHGAATDYKSNLNLGPDINDVTPYNLTAGHTLVSSHGRTGTLDNRECVYSLAALHAVSSVPATLSFRPTYSGGTATKTIHAVSEVQWDVLGDVNDTDDSPGQANVEAGSRRLWFEHYIGYPQRCLRDYERGAYGTNTSSTFGDMILWTNTDHTQSEKQQSVYNLIQAGIDLYGCITSGTYGDRTMLVDGGHSQTKMRFGYAAVMLDDEDMLAALMKTGDYAEVEGVFGKWLADLVQCKESQVYRVQAKHVVGPPWKLGVGSNYYSYAGTANVTNGSAVVTGEGTSWLTAYGMSKFAVQNGSWVASDDKSSNIDATAYSIASVDSNTQLTLSTPYTGETAEDVYYLCGTYICYGHGAITQAPYIGGWDTTEFTVADINLPVWGIDYGSAGYETPTNSSPGQGAYTGSPDEFERRYQPTAQQACASATLAAIIMDMRTEFNQDSAFDYMDRVATVNDQYLKFQGTYSRSMWEEHRASYPPVWEPKCHTPVPSHSATDIGTDQVLSWYDGNGRATGTSCNVYFGTDSTPDETELVDEESTDYEYTPELAAGTTYYWRVDEVCAGGTYTGDVWSFTTEGEEPPAETKYLLIRKN